MSRRAKGRGRKRRLLISRDDAGKFIAVAANGVEIVARGGTFEECEEAARRAGHDDSKGEVAIMDVPAGRFRPRITVDDFQN